MQHISEHRLHRLWELRLLPPDLHTTTGLPVEVLEPGEHNTDAGPDFRGALVRIGGVVYRGDVELHVEGAGWSQHGHDRDPHYNMVVLHVCIADARSTPPLTEAGRRIPVLLLDPDALPDPPPPGPDTLPCYPSNIELPLNTIRAMLRGLTQERLSDKVHRMEERMCALIEQEDPLSPILDEDWTSTIINPRIWDQLCYEEIAECLGYSKNRAPMRMLAGALPLRELRKADMTDLRTMEALLFGASGLLPAEGVGDAETTEYVAALRAQWHANRPVLHEPQPHAADWMFFRLRPANFPTARIAVLAALLPQLWDGRGILDLMDLFRSTPPPQLRRQLNALFSVQVSEYWRHRTQFLGPSGPDSSALGLHRLNDILVNAVIPIAVLFGGLEADPLVREHALALFAEMPRLQDNVVLCRMREEFLQHRLVPLGAADQQALLQLYTRYCRLLACEICPAGRKESSLVE